MTPRESSFLEPLLPRALDFVTREEARALRDGVELSTRERELAARCGVAHPERVRLLRVSQMPQPDDAMLREAQMQSGFSLSDAGGLTLGHAVFIVEREWRDEALIAHELVHVGQYERLGHEAFLRAYLQQVLSVGYHQAPMEREAVETSRRVLSESRNQS